MRKLAAIEQSGYLGPVTPPPLPVCAPAFDGPLGLLLQLIARGRITLLDIPLSPLANAYLDYLGETSASDLESAGSALLAIAYLIERKASLLVPGETEPIEDELEFVTPTANVFHSVVADLSQRFEHRQRIFFRQPEAAREPYQFPVEYGELRPDDLARALRRLLEAAIPREMEHQPNRPHFSLREKMDEIQSSLAGSVMPQPFEFFLGQSYTRLEVVWVFLAVLELLRLNLVDVTVRADMLLVGACKAVVRMEVQA